MSWADSYANLRDAEMDTITELGKEVKQLRQQLAALREVVQQFLETENDPWQVAAMKTALRAALAEAEVGDE